MNTNQKMSNTPKPHVYVLYTGGTIGCAGSPLAPLPSDKFAELVAAQPGFTLNGPNSLSLLVNVNDEEDLAIDVTMDDITPAIDSSSMSPREWVLIAKKILKHYAAYKGVVVLHGTDTMSFTASALSYLLGSGVSKPIILTGSQVPLSKTRNDALRNLITSITVAASQSINEVGLVFDNKILRGNRSVKVSSSAFPAFDSPNCAALGTVGIEIKMNPPLLLSSPPAKQSLDVAGNIVSLDQELGEIQKNLESFSVISIILHPGIQSSTIKAMLENTTPKVKGVVLQAFGAGNAPANEQMIETLHEAHDRNGVVIVDITQIVSGGVDLDAYESASGLRHAGAISGYDLTPEAALAKLVHLIAKGHTQSEVEREMKVHYQGDLSHEVKEESDRHWVALTKKRGHSSIVRRLLKKRKAAEAS